MAVGLEIYNSTGGVVFSSANSLGGVYAGKVTVAGNASATVYFDGTGGNPNLIGKTIRVLEVGPGGHTWTVTQASTPYVTVTKRTYTAYDGFSVANTTLLVFVI